MAGGVRAQLGVDIDPARLIMARFRNESARLVILTS
jgi:hypothetical protein